MVHPGLRRPSAAERNHARSRLDLVAWAGVKPSTATVLGDFLDAALPRSGGSVLDAGCGRLSALVAYRSRIDRLVGVDIHPPERPLPWVDEFRVADLCTDSGTFPTASFDLVLSSFTVEHLQNTTAALRNVRSWLRPCGTIVISTVNRRHPLVNAYLSLPPSLRRRLQRTIKATPADAHPLVGTCNTPGLLRRALLDAGFEDIDIQTTGHLAAAWQRRLPSFLLGLLGDMAAQSFASRRSTIVARASAGMA